MSWDTVKAGDRIALTMSESRNVGTVVQAHKVSRLFLKYDQGYTQWFYRDSGWAIEILPPLRPAWLDDSSRCIAVWSKSSGQVIGRTTPGWDFVEENPHPHLFRPLWLLNGDVVPMGTS